MKRYQSSIPHAALGAAAVALTAMTLGLWVIAPAKMGPGNQDAHAQSAAATPAAVEAAPGTTRIDVFAVRPPTPATVLVRQIQPAPPKHKQQT